MTASKLAESERNRSLRRVDWRFLLPNPRPRQSVCYADGLLAVGVAAISPKVWSLADAAHTYSGQCDLAVAIDPSTSQLAAAWQALQPGGVCYSEWYWPLAGGWRGVTRRLQAAGFTAGEAYWAWPWPNRAPATYWAPLAAPGVLDYLWQSRPKPQGRLQQVGHVGQRLVARLALALGIMPSLCVVVHKPATLAVAAQPPWLAQIQAEWRDRGLGDPPRQLHWLLLTGGQRSINKVVGLVFAEGERQPRLVVKMPRVPESLPALTQEAATLRALQTRQPGGVPGVPRVLFYQADGDMAALGETALTGMPLWRILRRENFRSLAESATEWLIQFAGSVEASKRDGWWERLVAARLTEFAASFGAIVTPDLLAQLRLRLETLADLPLVCEQRDFSPWNVLIDATGELVVLDWESAELAGLPLLDLIYFLTYLALFVEGVAVQGQVDLAAVRRVYRATLDPNTFVGAVVQACVARYCERLDMARGMVQPLRMLAWLIHSRSEYLALMAEGGGQPEPAVLRRSLFVNLLEEELVRVA